MLYGSEGPGKRPNLIADSWYPDYNDPWDAAATLVTTSNDPPAGTNGGFYHNAQVDALFADMKNAPTERAVSDAIKVQEIMAQDPPGIWTDERAMVNVMAKNIQGLAINPFGADVYTAYPMYRS
jgi:ABC-type transport system substrate-binding protein